jgi:hypothetical protein
MRVYQPILIGSLILSAPSNGAASDIRPLSNGKALIQITFKEKDRLVRSLPFTNVMGSGSVERDSQGSRIFIRVETGTNANMAQELRTQQLVIISALGVRIKPWRYPANERVGDDKEATIWQPPNSGWQVRSGEVLSQDVNLADASGDWIALTRRGRPPSLANLTAPSVPVAELPNALEFISIFAKSNVVHAFARRSWRNADGPMQHLVYDFSRGRDPIQQSSLSWGRAVLDMDPVLQFAVINDNNRFWGKSWLLDLKKGKRKWISTDDWTLIVQEDVARKWKELVKH